VSAPQHGTHAPPMAHSYTHLPYQQPCYIQPNSKVPICKVNSRGKHICIDVTLTSLIPLYLPLHICLCKSSATPLSNTDHIHLAMHGHHIRCIFPFRIMQKGSINSHHYWTYGTRYALTSYATWTVRV